MERGGEKRGRELESGRGRKGGKEGVRERVRKDEVEKEKRGIQQHTCTLSHSHPSVALCAHSSSCSFRTLAEIS